MRVAVCVKEVSQLIGPVSIGRDGRLAPESLGPAVNPNDLFALEEALRLRSRGVARQVVAVTAGSGELARTVSWCYAMGVDRVVRLRAGEFSILDSFGCGRALAVAIRGLDVGLVLCGQRSSDEGTGLVPPAIAGALGLPYVSEAARLTVEERRLTVERKLERGARAVWRTRLPAVVACAGDINVPRYVSVAAEVLARRAAPVELDWAALHLDAVEMPPRAPRRGLMMPRTRPKKTSTSTLGMSTADKMQLIMSGGVAQKSEKQVVRGDPDTLARAVVAYLDEHRLLPSQRGSRSANDNASTRPSPKGSATG